MPLTIRSAVAGLPSYVPGRPAAATGLSHKLSSNENPFDPLPGVLEAVAAAAGRMNRYPDMANTEITAAVADRLGVDPARISFGTGSVAVLYQLLQAVCEPGDEVVFAWRSFEAYPIAVQLTGARPVPVPLTSEAEHDLPGMLAAVGPATRAILLCTPNNPTGPALRHAGVVDFLAQVPESVLVVVDEAYVEFVTSADAVRGMELLDRPNVAVLRTFSKAYGLAGFRVGFCVTEAALAGAVRAVSLPFGVSGPAQAAVLASLAAEAELLERVAELVRRRDALLGGLGDLGWAVPDAQGNFVWLPTGVHTLDDVATFGAAGLIVRGFAGDGIRITVGNRDANTRVLEVAASLRSRSSRR